MVAYNQEEELLQKRLEELENRYKETLFSHDSLVNELEKKIVVDSKEETNKKQFRQLHDWKIENHGQGKIIEERKRVMTEPEVPSPPIVGSENKIEFVEGNKEKKGFLRKFLSVAKQKGSWKDSPEYEDEDEEVSWPKKIVQGETNKKIVIEKEIIPDIKRFDRLPVPTVPLKEKILNQNNIPETRRVPDIIKKEETIKEDIKDIKAGVNSQTRPEQRAGVWIERRGDAREMMQDKERGNIGQEIGQEKTETSPETVIEPINDTKFDVSEEIVEAKTEEKITPEHEKKISLPEIKKETIEPNKIEETMPKKEMDFKDDIIEAYEEEVKKAKAKPKPAQKHGKEKGEMQDDRPSIEEIKDCAEKIRLIKKEVSKALVGQDEIVDGLVMGLICNSHVLVEGVPGVAKTLAIKTIANVIGCDVKRVQFTVDLLPTDIIGITTYTPDKGFEIVKGPIFTNFLIADEINRAPPKTQSALIEAMQEKQVSIGRERFSLPAPFFVMATENPIENAGVYPLPEAQIDRFLLKLIMGYPKFDEEIKILTNNMTSERFEDFNLQSVVTPEDIIEMQEIVKRVYVDDSVKAYILSIVRKTRDRDFSMAEYISYGSSPRASIGLFLAGKARALMEGRNYVIPEDVKKIAFSVLRHRLILSYKANIKKISEDSIVQDILNSVKVD